MNISYIQLQILLNMQSCLLKIIKYHAAKRQQRSPR